MWSKVEEVKNNLPKICYHCGISLSEIENKREHVPPLGFFPKGHRENLMTVPSCDKHNNDTSDVDEIFQLYIKLHKTNDVADKDLKNRVKRGFNREEKKGFVKNFNTKTGFGTLNDKTFLFTKIEPFEPNIFFEKIIRGIYFYHKEVPTKGIIQWVSKHFLFEGLDSHSYFDFLVKDFDERILSEGYYSNPEVFKYQYLDAFGLFTVFMDFYEGVKIIGTVFPNGFTFDNFDVREYRFTEKFLNDLNKKTKINFPKI